MRIIGEVLTLLAWRGISSSGKICSISRLVIVIEVFVKLVLSKVWNEKSIKNFKIKLLIEKRFSILFFAPSIGFCGFGGKKMAPTCFWLFQASMGCGVSTINFLAVLA